jgi:hypothetical protein
MLVVLALLAVTGLQSTAAATCNAGDKAALVAFKAAIKTDPAFDDSSIYMTGMDRIIN